MIKPNSKKKKPKLNPEIASLSLLAAGLFLVVVIGCSSIANRESMLSAAGFKMAPANTPEKEAHLRSLPAGKITPVQHNGKVYYTFPDPKQNMLYVGREAQYREYRRLRLQKQTVDEHLGVAQMTQESAADFWRPWSEPGWSSR